MTIGIVFIVFAMSVGIALIGVGLSFREKSEALIMGLLLFIISGVIIGARNDNIEKENARLECIKSGKEVIEVLGTKVCKL